MVKLYITKYALTKGIVEVLFAGTPPIKGSYLYPVLPGGYSAQCKVGRDIFESKVDAFLEANRMRDNRIESLKKSIRKLEKLRFLND